MFSALNGHILDWILLPDEEATDHQAEPDNIINFISFEESTYSTDPAIKKLEAEVRLATRLGAASVSDHCYFWLS